MLLSLVRQRVFQIACGYEDQNDSETLREDPLFKVACSSMPESGELLAIQPTICRLENAATRSSGHKIAEVLFELYLSLRQGRRSRKDTSGFRRHRRPHPRGAGGQPLPRLLPPAHVSSSAARLRRRERASYHGAPQGGKHPRLEHIRGPLEAHSLAFERKVAECRHRDEGRRGLRRARRLRLL